MPYKVKQPMITTLAVQRLVVILPAEEQEEQIQRQAEEEERLRVAGLPPIKEMILQGRSKKKVLSTDVEKAGQTGTGDEEEEGQGSPGGDMEGHPVGEADLYLEKGNGLDIQEERSGKQQAGRSRSRAQGLQEAQRPGSGAGPGGSRAGRILFGGRVTEFTLEEEIIWAGNMKKYEVNCGLYQFY